MSQRQVIRTACPRNCYCTFGMLVTVEGGRIVGIEGNPLNPATQGTVCLKGLSYAERVTHPQAARMLSGSWTNGFTIVSPNTSRCP
jgi:anaerobic selenocysteine-containing dehydrogenase